MPFQITKEQHPTTGDLNGTIFVLQNRDSGDLIRLWPALGFNCYQWQANVNGNVIDALYSDPEMFSDGRPTRSGIPILFPFPNRIRDGRFVFQDKQYQLPLTDSSRKNASHGFVCRKPWRVTDQGAEGDHAWITGEFVLSRDDPESAEHWPADFRLLVRYRLSHRRLRIEAEVVNLDKSTLPFGLGYHPYFSVPLTKEGTPENCMIQVPADEYWVLDDSIPTGERKPVDDSRDLTKPRAYSELSIDDVLTGIQPSDVEAPEGLRWNGKIQQGNATLHVFSSLCYRELVVFTPKHREAFCIEPYTCPTNTMNLQHDQDVGLLTLEPDRNWTSVVELVL